MEKKKNSVNTINRYRVETVFDACKYKGCTNRRLSKGGMHLFRFPTCGNPRLLTWIKNTGNNFILNWSVTTLRKAGICGDHFTEDSFQTPDRTKLKPDAVPKPCGGSCREIVSESVWDHTYAKEEEGGEEAEIVAGNSLNKVDIDFKPWKSKCTEKAKAVTDPVIWLPQRRTPWKSNPTFIRTYSRKLSFKDSDNSMEWTVIEPGCAEDDVGERSSAPEALKHSVAVDKTASVGTLVTEHENPEITELRTINRELRRQNKILQIENFKLQMRLVASNPSKSQR